MQDEHKVVRITNIADFDFTGELGARYGGRDFVIAAGKSLLFPLPLGRHLAKHLAQQILLRKAPTRDEKELDGKGKDRPLWNEESLNELIKKIMSDVYEEEPTPILSEGDRVVQRVNELNQTKQEIDSEEGGNADASDIVPVGGVDGDGKRAPSEPENVIVYKDKKEVIEELNKRGIQFNARSSKTTLEGLLK